VIKISQKSGRLLNTALVKVSDINDDSLSIKFIPWPQRDLSKVSIMRKILNTLNLSAKFLPPILCGTLIALIAVSVFLLNAVKKSTQEQLELARQSLVVEQKTAEAIQLKALNSKADSLGLFMSQTAPDLIISYDFSSLQSYQENAMKDPDVAYAAYLKPDGKPFTKLILPKDKKIIIEKKYNVISDDELIGTVLLGMSKVKLVESVKASNQRINSAVKEIEKNADSAVTEFVTLIVIGVVIILLLITVIVYILFRLLILSRLSNTNELITQLSKGNGDLTLRLPVANKDEVSQLCLSVNQFIAQLQEMVAGIVIDVQTLMHESEQLSTNASELSIISDTQSNETSKVATAMNQMTTTVLEVAKNANNAADAARNSDQETSLGKKVIKNTIVSINDLVSEVENASQVIHTLESDTDSVGSVLDVIKGIAEQTNLLALNAAIEAARAGEQGRGFAVVADEVRTLASRTQASTAEIQEMIEKIQSGSQHAVSVMNESSERAKTTVKHAAEGTVALENISNSVSTINEMNTQIAIAAEQQTSVAEEINQNIVTIHNISEKTSEGAQKSAQSSSTLSNLAQHLQGLVSQFKI